MKESKIKIREANIKTDDFIELREAIGWNCVEKNYIARALENNLYSVHARTDNRIIGYGRVIGDDGFTFYIQDMMVYPKYQGMGVGKKLMNKIMNFLINNYPEGSMVCLMAAKEKKAFYKRFGFTERPNENYGPGMIKNL